MFKEAKKDVLVATDIAGKGLDFPDVQHVINFDMPKEIENYGSCQRSLVHSICRTNCILCAVHRIGRTGRCGKTGVATTFINKNCDETILLDLKQLLVESKQRIPLCLQSMEGPGMHALFSVDCFVFPFLSVSCLPSLSSSGGCVDPFVFSMQKSRRWTE